MRLRRPVALGFGLGLILGLGAMAWVTLEALRSDRGEQAAQARVASEAKVRQALARMDATMGLFLAPESARPWSHYAPFSPLGQVHIDQPAAQAGPWLPSPLLLGDDPLVKVRFQVDALGHFTSPLVPEGADRARAHRLAIDPQRLLSATSGLAALSRRFTLASLKGAMARQGAVLLSREQVVEYEHRRGNGAPRQGFLHQGGWVPFWEGGDLFLARQTWVGEAERIQGSWMDAEGMREVLLSTIRGELPKAELRPAHGGLSSDRPRLGSLPYELVPGEGPAGSWQARRATRLGLAFGWVCVLTGTAAGAFALYRAVIQGERRGALAASVTHELRTPLTTFRLYTELLAKDMVPDPEARQELVQSLAVEADRLDHLVKNMLAYARLEARREGNLVALPLDGLLDQVLPRLRARADQAGMPLHLSVDSALVESVVRVDALVVEQILYNLVDNACKYGAGDLELDALPGRRGVILRLRDHGPGIPHGEQRDLFDPFHKSRHASARTAPGVGLGLALCRRLARSLGGDLELDRSVKDGAAFRLLLPSVRR